MPGSLKRVCVSKLDKPVVNVLKNLLGQNLTGPHSIALLALLAFDSLLLPLLFLLLYDVPLIQQEWLHFIGVIHDLLMVDRGLHLSSVWIQTLFKLNFGLLLATVFVNEVDITLNEGRAATFGAWRWWPLFTVWPFKLFNLSLGQFSWCALSLDNMVVTIFENHVESQLATCFWIERKVDKILIVEISTQGETEIDHALGVMENSLIFLFWGFPNPSGWVANP